MRCATGWTVWTCPAIRKRPCAPLCEGLPQVPARVPQIHLGPEYYSHMAFTELTEANARVKDGVFGVYGSLLLSELSSRKRLGTLTPEDKKRYARLQPLYPELLTPVNDVDSLSNSAGMRLIRIPTPGAREWSVPLCLTPGIGQTSSVT